MLQVNVVGGTGAGRRRLTGRPKDWVCPKDGTALKYHWNACPLCGTPRPKEANG